MRHQSNISKPARLISMTDYLPYGNILQWYSFQGRHTRFMTTYHSLSRIIGKRDSTTLLDYRGARFSDPHVGGFISIDPLAGKFPGWSPYNYVMNNPVRLTDPTGMEPCTDCPKNAKKGDTYDHTEYGKLEFNGDSWSNDEYGMILNDANITAKQSSSTGFDIKSSISKGILLGGTVTGGLEASIYTSNSFTGEEIWHGKTTGKFYSSQDFHPNNYVMNQSKTLAKWDSRFFRVGSQSMFFAGSALTAVDMYNNPTASNIGLGSLDIGMGAVGTYGGPIGLGVSFTYTINRLSIGAFAESQKAGYTQTNPTPTFNYVGGLAPTYFITR